MHLIVTAIYTDQLVMYYSTILSMTAHELILTVLLEYIDVFNHSGSIKQVIIWKELPTLLPFSIAIILNLPMYYR